MKRAAVFVACAVSVFACGEFEVPEIVLDLRPLAMTATPPEVVLPPDESMVSIGDVPDIDVCALIADPTNSRGLTYTFTACPPSNDGRCDDDVPTARMGTGRVEDPEEAATPVQICGTLRGNGDLIAIAMESVRLDDLAGFGGIGVQIALKIEPDGASPAELLFASKTMRFSAQVPEQRVANVNPTVQRFVGVREATGTRGRDFDVPIGRCIDVEPMVVLAGERITILPVEPEGAREDYVVPTLDGDVREFTENLSYAWFATEGSWSSFETGGQRDPAGNEPRLETSWRAPDDPEIVGTGINVPMWFVQRDERGGSSWYESCARVVP